VYASGRWPAPHRRAADQRGGGRPGRGLHTLSQRRQSGGGGRAGAAAPGPDGDRPALLTPQRGRPAHARGAARRRGLRGACPGAGTGGPPTGLPHLGPTARSRVRALPGHPGRVHRAGARPCSWSRPSAGRRPPWAKVCRRSRSRSGRWRSPQGNASTARADSGCCPPRQDAGGARSRVTWRRTCVRPSSRWSSPPSTSCAGRDLSGPGRGRGGGGARWSPSGQAAGGGTPGTAPGGGRRAPGRPRAAARARVDLRERRTRLESLRSAPAEGPGG